MKLSTIVSRVIKFYEGGRRWGRDYMLSPNGRYCILGAACHEITLAPHLYPGVNTPDDLLTQLNDQRYLKSLTRWEYETAVAKLEQIKQLDFASRNWLLTTEARAMLKEDRIKWDDVTDLMSLNDHPAMSKKRLLKYLKAFRKFLKENEKKGLIDNV